MEIDNEYWSGLQDPEEGLDPLATVIKQLESMKRTLDFSMASIELLPSCIEKLSLGRKELVIKTEKSFSDILTMVAEFNAGEESLFETTKKMCDYYREHVGT